MNLVRGLVAFGVIAVMTSLASAKRSEPRKVPPVVFEGVKYSVVEGGRLAGERQNGGFVEASDAKTEKVLWRLKVYRTKYDWNLEQDVQDVFLTAMQVQEGALIVRNEKSETHAINLKTREVRKISNQPPQPTTGLAPGRG